MDDAIYNFSRVYQQYAQQGDASEDEQEMSEKRESPSASEEDRYIGVPGSSTNKKRSSPKGSEKASLLVESDEEEIF